MSMFLFPGMTLRVERVVVLICTKQPTSVSSRTGGPNYLQGVNEVHYLHAKWSRARSLAKLRGTHVTALAFPPLLPSDMDFGGSAAAAAGTNGTGGTSKAARAIASTRSVLSETCTG